MSTEHQEPAPDEQAAQRAAGASDGPAAAATAEAEPEAAPQGPAAGDAEVIAEPAADPLEGKSEDEIRALAAQAGEYLGLAQRTRADFDNYRKRAQRDVGAARQRGGAALARELLPALDNVERAVEHEAKAITGEAADAEHAQRILAALRTAHSEFVAALARAGVERFDPTGEPFDPQRHEAMARRPAQEGEGSGICAVVYEAGYAAGDEIVRPARVVVTD